MTSACLSSKATGVHPYVLVLICESRGVPRRHRRTRRRSRIATVLVRDGISSAVLNRKWLLPIADAAEQRRQVSELFRHHVDNITFPLHTPAAF